MDTLQIASSRINLSVNGDENRLISFDPEDIVFVTGFYQLAGAFAQKEEEYRTKVECLDPGDPKSAQKAADLAVELLHWLREEIDRLFGAGTSLAAFGEGGSPLMLRQFFEGVTPYIRSVREQKVSRYTTDGDGALQ